MEKKTKKLIIILGIVLLILGLGSWQYIENEDEVDTLIEETLVELGLAEEEETEAPQQAKTTSPKKKLVQKDTKKDQQDKKDVIPPKKGAKTKLKVTEFSINKKISILMGVRTTKAKASKKSLRLNFTGKLSYNQDRLTFVTTRQKGIVRQINKTIGDYAREGDVLLELESVELGKAQENYRNALALLKEAKKNYQRTEYLYSRRIITENEYLKARSEYQVHLNSVRNTQNDLRLLGYNDFYNLEDSISINPVIPLKSPFSGRIIERYANSGQMITPNKPAYKIADLSTLWLHLDVFEKDFRYLKKRQVVYFSPTSYPEKIFKARVDYLNSEVMGMSRTIKVRAIVQNKGWKLLPNMYVKSWIEVKYGDKVVTVPDSAILHTGKRQMVFIYLGKNKFIPREVITGQYFNSEVTVIRGLKEGETVVSSPNFLFDSESQLKSYIKEVPIVPEKDSSKNTSKN